MSEEIKSAADLQTAIADIADIGLVSSEEQAAIRRNTAFALPNSPVEYGMRADVVKPAFWRGIVGATDEDENNVVAFLNRLAKALNEDLGTLREVLKCIVELHETDNGTLGKSITDEVTARESADETLGGRIDNEAEARAEADTALGKRMLTLEGIGDATSAVRGYMTPEQVSDLKTLLDIGDASDAVRGYMTPEQVQALEMLEALFEDDADTVINTISEVLAAFENSPEGTNIVNALSQKLGVSHASSTSAHSDLFADKFASHDNDLLAHSRLRNWALSLLDSKISKSGHKQCVYINNSDGDAYIKFYTSLPTRNTLVYRDMSGYFSVLDAVYDDNPTSLRQVNSIVSPLKKRIEKLGERIGRLEIGLDVGDFITDATAAYQKAVPQNVLSYAAIEKIGGAAVYKSLDRVPNLFANNPFEERDEKGWRVEALYEAAEYILVVTRHTLSLADDYFTLYTEEFTLPAGDYTLFAETGGLDYELSLYSQENDEAFVDYGGGVRVRVTNDGLYKASLSLCSPSLIENKAVRVFLKKDALSSAPVTKVVSRYANFDVRDTFVIPAEIQALNGYGAGNPDNPAEANYIDLEARKFVAYGYMDDPAADYPDFKVWVPYEEPVETDISAYLPADNLIRVAAGGTLTFVNDGGLAVPSTVTYQQKEVTV